MIFEIHVYTLFIGVLVAQFISLNNALFGVVLRGEQFIIYTYYRAPYTLLPYQRHALGLW